MTAGRDRQELDEVCVYYLVADFLHLRGLHLYFVHHNLVDVPCQLIICARPALQYIAAAESDVAPKAVGYGSIPESEKCAHNRCNSVIKAGKTDYRSKLPRRR